MSRFIMLTAIAAIAVIGQSSKAPSSNSTAQPATTLHIISVRNAKGELKGSLQTRPQPYRAGIQMSLQLALPNQKTLRTEDGLAVNGFGFYAWDESGVTHLRILLLVPKKGVANVYLWDKPDFDAAMLQATEFAYYKLSMDETRRVDEMKRIGLEPMQVHLGSTMPLR